jgi:hypothetical protein
MDLDFLSSMRVRGVNPISSRSGKIMVRCESYIHRNNKAWCRGQTETLFYRWQKEFFENGAAAFRQRGRPKHRSRFRISSLLRDPYEKEKWR